MNAEMEKILEAWGTFWSSHDVEHLLSFFSNDCTYDEVTFGNVYQGKAEIKAFVEEIFAVFPDFKVENRSWFAANDRGSVEWTISGIHKGDLPGAPATNQQFSIRGVTIIHELESGKVKHCSDYWDFATLLKQTGLLPSDLIR